jgi:hypothetical protein
MVASCVDVAVMVAVPVVAGAKTPVLLTEPILDGLRDQVTALLKLPVPLTVAVQAEVCVVSMEAGEQATETDVIVPLLPVAVPTTTDAVPDSETS